MTNLPAPGRRYTEKEVSRLLKRTAELQRASPNTPNSRGLSLDELQEIAAEAGLDVSLLRQAAREMEAGGPAAAGMGAAIAGGPMMIVIEQTLPYEVPESAYESIVAHVQIAAPTQGTASQIGRTLTWQTQGQPTMALHVVVTVRNGETLVRIEEKHGTLAGALFGGGLAGGSGVAIAIGGITAGAAAPAALVVAAPVALMGLSYGLFRTIFASKSKKRRQALAELMDRIVADIEAARTSEPHD
jgi:hypothetical protein